MKISTYLSSDRQIFQFHVPACVSHPRRTKCRKTAYASRCHMQPSCIEATHLKNMNSGNENYREKKEWRFSIVTLCPYYSICI